MAKRSPYPLGSLRLDYRHCSSLHRAPYGGDSLREVLHVLSMPQEVKPDFSTRRTELLSPHQGSHNLRLFRFFIVEAEESVCMRVAPTPPLRILRTPIQDC
jgi:hypothetical protein